MRKRPMGIFGSVLLGSPPSQDVFIFHEQAVVHIILRDLYLL